MIRKIKSCLGLAVILSLILASTAYAIGPGEGMGSQGGTVSSAADSNPWYGYTELNGSDFSYLERGVSISKFQNQMGSINWSQVKADGIDFAIVRVAYGLTEDPYFDENITGAQNAGIKTGAYLCATARNLSETIAEAELTVSKIKKYQLSYPVAYDMEVSSMLSEGATAAELTEMANKFCEIVAGAGYTPVVYANTNWLTNHLIVSRIPYDIWFAAYPADKVYRPVAGSKTTIWQTGDKGTVKGIRGYVTTEFSRKAYGGGSPSTKYAGRLGGSTGYIYAGGLSLSSIGPLTTAAKDGWSQDSSGNWLYYESGRAVSGWKQVGEYWYYFDENQLMRKGWTQVNGSWYYLGAENGDMKTGWRQLGDVWYYLDSSGAMLSDTSRSINGVEYRFDINGACLNA